MSLFPPYIVHICHFIYIKANDNSVLRNEALPLLCVRRNLNFQDSEWQCYSNGIFFMHFVW